MKIILRLKYFLKNKNMIFIIFENKYFLPLLSAFDALF